MEQKPPTAIASRVTVDQSPPNAIASLVTVVWKPPRVRAKPATVVHGPVAREPELLTASTRSMKVRARRSDSIARRQTPRASPGRRSPRHRNPGPKPGVRAFRRTDTRARQRTAHRVTGRCKAVRVNRIRRLRAAVG